MRSLLDYIAVLLADRAPLEFLQKCEKISILENVLDFKQINTNQNLHYHRHHYQFRYQNHFRFPFQFRRSHHL